MRLIILLITTAVCVRAIIVKSPIAAACLHQVSAIGKSQFHCVGQDLDLKCRCSDPLFLTSLHLCILEYAGNYRELTAGLDFIGKSCDISSSAVQRELNKFSKGSPAFREMDLIRVNLTSYQQTSNDVHTLAHHRRSSTCFGIVLLIYWGLVLLVGVSSNFVEWCKPSWKMKLNGPISGWFRRFLILPNLFGRNLSLNSVSVINSKFNTFLKILPSRLETLLVVSYVALIVIFSCVDYELQQPGYIFEDRKREMLVYIGDRSGIMAVLQVPMIYIFSARNNVLIYLTGWNYRNFNMFHRLISRVVWVMILIHTVAYVMYSSLNGDYQERWTLEKWRWAHVGFISASLAIVVSFRPFRKAFYEWFKSFHQIFAVLFLAGVWNHCKTLGWMWPIYLATANFALDHFLRWTKVMVSGFVNEAKCEAIVNPHSQAKEVHSIRVTINHSSAWRCFPGCYVHLCFLTPTTFWQSHPFTLLEPSIIENSNQLVMLIKVKNGLTRHLGEMLQRQPERTRYLKVFVEGPYGSPIPFRSYENSIFVAGGIGITVVYTFAMDLIRQYKAEMKRKEGDRKITLIWVTPTVESVECFANELRALNEAGLAEISIYITRDEGYVRADAIMTSYSSMTSVPFADLTPVRAQAEVSDIIGRISQDGVGGKTDSNEASPAMSDISERRALTSELFAGNLPYIRVIFMKPNIDRLLQHEVNLTLGTLAIVSCGPERLNRDVKSVAIRSVGLPTNERIDYFEEQLLW